MIMGYGAYRPSADSMIFFIMIMLCHLCVLQVPSCERHMSLQDVLENFCCELPVLNLIKNEHLVSKDEPYAVDADVQLVCKYLNALKTGAIDHLYKGK